MLHTRVQSRRFVVFLLFLFCLALGALAQDVNQSDRRGKEQERQPLQYELVAKGVVATPSVKIQFKSAPLRLEIRNLVMGRGETESIPTPTRILLELRQGAVTTTINQQKHGWNQGDFWVVDQGTSFSVHNSGEVAVLRAIYIFEGSR
jgi:hypothetical protein